MRTTQIYSDIDGNASITTDSSEYKLPGYAFGINVNSGTEWVNLVLEYDYHLINTSSLDDPAPNKLKFHELYAGLRFFPMKPTFIIGNVSLRPTFGGSIGFDLEPNYRGMWFGGINVSGIRNVSGIACYFIYRTGTHVISGYSMQPFWSIRLALVIGPSAK